MVPGHDQAVPAEWKKIDFNFRNDQQQENYKHKTYGLIPSTKLYNNLYIIIYIFKDKNNEIYYCARTVAKSFFAPTSWLGRDCAVERTKSAPQHSLYPTNS